MTDSVIDWLTGWLATWLITSQSDWLINWMTYWAIDWRSVKLDTGHLPVEQLCIAMHIELSLRTICQALGLAVTAATVAFSLIDLSIYNFFLLLFSPLFCSFSFVGWRSGSSWKIVAPTLPDDNRSELIAWATTWQSFDLARGTNRSGQAAGRARGDLERHCPHALNVRWWMGHSLMLLLPLLLLMLQTSTSADSGLFAIGNKS